MQVSFIIPLFNCLDLTQAMLASLRATLPTSVTHEIIFVDDGSTDGTRAWLAAQPSPGRFILNARNLGFAGTCNRGAAAARGDFLFFLNNDLVLTPGWLEPMLALLGRPDAVGLVGNVQLNAASGAIDHAGIFFNHKGKPQHHTTRTLWAWLSGVREVGALTGACFGIRRKLWTDLGGFDDGFVNGGEDVDLCLRAGVLGLHHFIAVRSVVRHHVSASAGRKLRDEQNTQRLVRRWRDTIARAMSRTWCRHYLATHWADPRDFPDQAFARATFYYLLRLRAHPPAGALEGALAAIDVELARWDEMFPSPTQSSRHSEH